MEDPKPLKSLLVSLQASLSAAIEVCSGSQESPNAPVILKLRSVLIALLDNCADSAQAKGKDIPTVLNVTDFVLQQLPAVVSSGTELLKQYYMRRDLVDQTVSLITRLPTLFEADKQHSATRDLFHGAIELILDAEQQFVNLSLPVQGGPAPQGSVPVFSALVAWRQSQVPLNDPVAGAAGSRMGSLTGPPSGLAEYDLEAPLGTQALCLCMAEAGVKLLSGLLLSHPLLLAPYVPPVLTSSLQQLVMYGDMEFQIICMEALSMILSVVPIELASASEALQMATLLLQIICMEALSMILSVVPIELASASEALQMATLLLQAWMDRFIVLDTSNPKAGKWQQALGILIEDSLAALKEQPLAILQITSSRTMPVMLNGCLAAEPGSALQASLRSSLVIMASLCSSLVVMVEATPQDAPATAVQLLPLLSVEGRTVEAIEPLWHLLNHWLTSGSVIQDAIQCEVSARDASLLDLSPAPALSQMPGAGQQRETIELDEDGIAIVDEKLGDADPARARKRRRLGRPLRQMQLACWRVPGVKLGADRQAGEFAGVRLGAHSHVGHTAALHDFLDAVDRLAANATAPVESVSAPAHLFAIFSKAVATWATLPLVHWALETSSLDSGRQQLHLRLELAALMACFFQLLLTRSHAYGSITQGLPPHALLLSICEGYQMISSNLSPPDSVSTHALEEADRGQQVLSSKLSPPDSVSTLALEEADRWQQVLSSNLSPPDSVSTLAMEEADRGQQHGTHPLMTRTLIAAANMAHQATKQLAAPDAMEGQAVATKQQSSPTAHPSANMAHQATVQFVAPDAMEVQSVATEQQSSPTAKPAHLMAHCVTFMRHGIKAQSDGSLDRSCFSPAVTQTLALVSAAVAASDGPSSSDEDPLGATYMQLAAVQSLFLILQLSAAPSAARVAASFAAASAFVSRTLAGVQQQEGGLSSDEDLLLSSQGSGRGGSPEGRSRGGGPVGGGPAQDWWPSLATLSPILSSLLFSSEGKPVGPQLATLAAVRFFLQHAPAGALQGGGALLSRMLGLLSHDSSLVRHAFIPVLGKFLRPPVLFELFGMSEALSATVPAAADIGTALSLCHDSSLVRHAFIPVLGKFLRPPVLFELFGMTEALSGDTRPGQGADLAPGHGRGGGQDRSTLARAEMKLMHELRSRLEATPIAAVRTTILQAAADLAGGLTGNLSQLMPLIMVVGCLGKDDIQVRAAATTSLNHICRCLGRSLDQLLLKSTETRVVLEYVGRTMAEHPDLLSELSRLLHMTEIKLVKLIIPHVIGWLCMNHRKADLQMLAELLETTMPCLFANYADHAIAHAFRVGSQGGFEEFVAFVDDIMAPDEDFVSVCKVTAREVARQVVCMAGLPSEWEDGYDPSKEVISRGLDYLDSLAKIAGHTGPDAASELLTGQTVVLLLKDFGAHFSTAGGGGLSANSNPNSIPTDSSAAHIRPTGADIESGQLQTLRALTVLILLLGPFIGNHAPHIMAVLTAGLRDVTTVELKSQALSAWRAFIRCLASKTPKLLERIAVQPALSAWRAFIRCLASKTPKLLERIAVQPALSAWRVFIRCLASKTPKLLERIAALSAWRVFIRCLASKTPKLLERIAVQAVVVLLEVLEEGGHVQTMAVSILEDIIIKQRKNLGTAIMRIPPLPSLEPLAAVNKVLANEQKLSNTVRQLRVLVSSLRGESPSVRHVALGELRIFLLNNKPFMFELIVGGLGIDISKGGSSSSSSGGLLRQRHAHPPGPAAQTALFRLPGCDNAMRTHLGLQLKLRCADFLGLLGALDPDCDNAMRTHLGLQLKLRCADCLGLLGALDPERINVLMPPPDQLCQPGETLELLEDLMVKHLVRILETTDNINTLDFTTYSIQSVLQQYSNPVSLGGKSSSEEAQQKKMIRSNSGTGTDNGLFNRLPKEVQPIVAPYLNSR
eukprot:gene24091-9665_t